jgi:hypothetical protein
VLDESVPTFAEGDVAIDWNGDVEEPAATGSASDAANGADTGAVTGEIFGASTTGAASATGAKTGEIVGTGWIVGFTDENRESTSSWSSSDIDDKTGASGAEADAATSSFGVSVASSFFSDFAKE